MDAFSNNPFSTHVNIDGGGSATAFAAITGGRWHMQAFSIGYQNMTSSVTISFLEIDSTNSGIIWTAQVSGTGGTLNHYLGEWGYMASSSFSSRLVFNMGGTAGTMTGIFTGFSTGQ